MDATAIISSNDNGVSAATMSNPEPRTELATSG